MDQAAQHRGDDGEAEARLAAHGDVAPEAGVRHQERFEHAMLLGAEAEEFAQDVDRRAHGVRLPRAGTLPD